MSGKVELMCPHCGELVEMFKGLTAFHDYPKPMRQVCPGSRQIPRSIYDRRRLWNGELPKPSGGEQ